MPTKNLFPVALICSLITFTATSCNKENIEDTVPSTTTGTTTTTADCQQFTETDDSRGACNETLSYTPEIVLNNADGQRTFVGNGIPDHKVGVFGGGTGSLNPNAISPQNVNISVTTSPQKASTLTWLLDTESGPRYAFGILLNGIELDPEAAEPWPHSRPVNFTTANWEWNLDAAAINLGLDCNNAHVQPTGKYHHHGAPTLYLESINGSSDKMTLVGYAADGFPIYYQYGYSSANDTNSGIKTLESSYRLKSGERPGDGIDAPCGEYNGIYTNDYEFVNGLGDLDECNGRTGVTPEFPQGTYYYVITDEFPYIGRCLVGVPSDDFRLR